MPIDFPPSALPFCVFSDAAGPRRLGIGIGIDVVDLAVLAPSLGAVDPALVTADRLNPLLAAGHESWSALREALQDLVAAGEIDRSRRPQNEVSLHLAWDVADYVDFYSSRHHAENVGRLFRPGTDPLPPNWLHLPAGYHGRSSSVVVSGTAIRRPRGLSLGADGEVAFGPSRRLDFELEVGFVVGGATAVGQPVPIGEAERHLFGVVLLNDWSARDIQAFEYVPLGPFLGKSFATSVSAWVMPLAALQDAKVPAGRQEPPPARYLRAEHDWSLSLGLEAWLQPGGSEDDQLITAVDAADGLYWTACQQLAHITVNGAPLTPGDLFGSGTVSGPDATEWGSLLELAHGGDEPIDVGGATRSFLEDGDVVGLRGTAPGPDGPLPLGPVTGEILSA